MRTEIKHVGYTESITMKAVPIIGEAVQDGSVERSYIEKLEELERGGEHRRFTDKEIENIPSRLLR